LFENWPFTVATTYQEPDDGKTFTERLLDLMKKLPKRDKTVYGYSGTLHNLIQQLAKAGVEIKRNKYCRDTYDTITGLDLVEVPEYNCVLIGNYSDIVELLEKESPLGFFKILERPEYWFQGRGTCSDNSCESGR
jgi:hypothetical protein